MRAGERVRENDTRNDGLDWVTDFYTLSLNMKVEGGEFEYPVSGRRSGSVGPDIFGGIATVPFM